MYIESLEINSASAMFNHILPPDIGVLFNENHCGPSLLLKLMFTDTNVVSIVFIFFYLRQTAVFTSYLTDNKERNNVYNDSHCWDVPSKTLLCHGNMQ